MKAKYKRIQKKEIEKWILTSNLFAKSLITPQNAISEYNSLSSVERHEIKEQFTHYDNLRRKKIPKGESDYTWEISVMVDSHIIATEHSINPLTAIMCLTPPCSISYNILFF